MTGLIPRPFIDDLLTRTDIVEFIDNHLPLKKRGNSYIACCPFHSEKTPSFNVVAKKQFYHCFGCGASGNAISFAMNYLNLGFSEAVETLAARLGIQVPREGGREKNAPSPSLYQFLSQVTEFYQQSLKTEGQAAISYLKQRHVNGQIATLYQLGYAPPGWNTLEARFKKNTSELIATGMLITKEDGKTYDRFRHRIMYPIHDRHGRIIGFGGRSIDPEQKPKYLNSPETTLFQKSHELYGLHQVLQQKSIENILIVEGYMDVIALAQHGIPNVVATLGTATSSYHIQLLSKYTKQLIFCFDGDTAGRQAAWRALESSLPYLNGGLDASFIFLPENHDPDSLVREEGKELFLKRLKEATPLHKFFVDTLTQGLDSVSFAGKSQLINAAKPYVLKMTDGPYKQLLIDELARLTRIESHRVFQLFEEKETHSSPDSHQKQITRSPIRIGIAILLQHPEIYTDCAAEVSKAILDPQKHGVLVILMQEIANDPTINTAKLVESFRDTPLFESINTLASWEHQVPEHALLKEFIDIILFLEKQTRENAIQQLMKKAHDIGLTESERLGLQAMLKQRHQQLNINHQTHAENKSE